MVLFSTSCNNHVKRNNTQSSKPKVDTQLNDRVQDTFFGATLGDDILVVYEKFVQHGFELLDYYSTDVVLHFKPKYSRFFSFGNMNWELVDVYAQNRRFKAISVQRTSNDKESILRAFEDLKNNISNKYSIVNVENQDTMIYAKFMVFGRNNTDAMIKCEKYETISGDNRFRVSLTYKTLKDLGGVKDEL